MGNFKIFLLLILSFTMFFSCGEEGVIDTSTISLNSGQNLIPDDDYYLFANLSMSPSSAIVPFTSTATISINASDGESPYVVKLYKSGNLYQTTTTNYETVNFSIPMNTAGSYSFYANVTSRNKTTTTTSRTVTALPSGYVPPKPSFPSSVYLKRVRYCTKYFLGICTKSSTNYSEWENNHVGNEHQKDTYIGIARNISRSNVEHINMFFAGQQTGDGVSNVVTGQNEDYKSGCAGSTSGCYRTIDSRGLAAEIYNADVFDYEKTFMAVVYDTQFNHMRLSGEKQDMEDAYFDWISNRFYSGNIKTIYLAGSSRGGCLAMRLAKRFRAAYSSTNVKVIVSSFDGVCKRTQNELGTTNDRDYNPLNDDKRGWHTNLYNVYSNKTNLNIYHISSGAKAPINGVRCFSYKDYDYTSTWYKQRWVNLEHTDVGRDYDSTLEGSTTTLIESQVDFVDSKMNPSSPIFIPIKKDVTYIR